MTAAALAAGTTELELLLRATVLIGAAWACAAARRRAGASASARHAAWLLGIAALLALPLLWWLAPALRLPILLAEAAAPDGAALRLSTDLAQSAAPDSPDAWAWSSILFGAYAAGVLLVLLRTAVFRHMLSRLWRDAEPACDAGWEELLRRVSREMRLTRRVELRIARGAAMPMTWGTLAPKVLLPAEAGDWPLERRRHVLLHELAHVARRDSLSRSAASLACALYWFHPGAWFAARQMRLEQEHAADDRVLTAGAPARNYALSLVHLARRIEPRTDHVAAMAGMAQLERRLVSITTPARRDLPGPAFLGLSASIACLVTWVVSAAIPVRPSLEPANAADSAFAAPHAPIPAARARADDRRQEQRETARRAEPVSATEAAPRDRAGRSDTATARVAAARLDGLPLAVEEDDASAPAREPVARAPVSAIEAADLARPFAGYGPRLPQTDGGADPDDDARIPEMARHRARGDSGNGRSPAGRGLPIRLVPADGAGRPGGVSLDLRRLGVSLGNPVP